ncbi:hypothetical protein BKA56DRAFT_613933 [Ilyonectria sp. MPI-CAGE-AT-0026]|nr:hypothetical protein BKA56DRAFT_613933 [Ilyonectria sp. MPI-CAGE-AT-0026]
MPYPTTNTLSNSRFERPGSKLFFPAAATRATPHVATAFANCSEHYLAVMGLMYNVASRDAEVCAFKRELSDYITTTCGYDGKRAPGDPAPFYLNLEQESMSPKDAFGDHV